MAQFNFINELNSALRMDDPITKGPVPRWQRKVIEGSSSNNSTINSSVNRTKTKTPNKLDLKKTPSKTPKPSPARGKSPCGGDRFIPNRSATDFNLSHFKLTLEDNDDAENDLKSPNKLEQERIMKENLHGGHDPAKTRILAFQKKAPLPSDGYQNPLKVVYSQSKTPSSKSTTRYIPQAPDRILDAPEIIDDYYLNLIDWSQSNNILAVALANSVYLWNAATGTISHLVELEGSDYVCSLSWVKESDMLAVGTSLGDIQVWDAPQSKRLRVMNGHSARVASLSWNSYILSSGCRLGLIVHHDVRQRDHNVSQINAHSQEVCGLKWSPDGKYLASGGNDNVLNIWQSAQDNFYSRQHPLFTFNLHQAAVKALAWCPWQAGLLASGGGTADRHIRLWNCNTGVNTLSVDTKSQVCGLLWSPTFKEIISGHGYANNELIIWKYPSMTKVAELTGHTARVLHLAMSPDGTTVLSAGADETLRLWKCFTPDSKHKKEHVDSKMFGNSIFKKGIR